MEHHLRKHRVVNPAASASSTALWAALRFICRDTILEGDNPRVRRQVEGLSDYELAKLRRAAADLVIMALDEHLARR